MSETTNIRVDSVPNGRPGDESPPRLPGDDDIERPPLPALPSWERFEEVGFWRAFLRSIPEVLFRPTATFRRLPRTRELDRPLFFAMVLGTATAAILICVQLVQGEPSIALELPHWLGAARLGIEETTLGPTALVAVTVGKFVIAPFLLILWLFLWTGIVHLLLLLLGAANHPINITFRTLCYVQGATMLLLLVPDFGGALMMVWALVGSSVGLAQSQETSVGKTGAAIVASLFLCCTSVAIAVLVVLALVSAVLKSMLQSFVGIG